MNAAGGTIDLRFPAAGFRPQTPIMERTIQPRDLIDLEDSATSGTSEPEISPSRGNLVQETSASDCESSVTDIRISRSGFFGDNMVRVDNNDKCHSDFKRAFLSGLGAVGKLANVVALHRNSHSSVFGKARFQAFRLFAEATAVRRGGGVNMKCAWYGASKDEISAIINHGFGDCDRPETGGLFGSGLYLSPANSSIDSIVSSVADEHGLKHVLLCRVILGNTEEVAPGSKQFHPSSQEFDSGVDNLANPKRYIIWSTHMNSHILPEYVISFTVPSYTTGLPSVQQAVGKPSSAWMPFPRLIALLSECLPPSSINLINRYYSDYQAKKITREYMIKRLRQIAGDKLLASAIRSFRAKKPSQKI